MSVSGVMPRVRRATYFVLPAVVALCVGTNTSAMAQSTGQKQATDSFSSSTESLVATSNGLAGAPANPAPTSSAALVAGQTDNSYGYHNHSYVSHLAFEAGAGFNAPIGNDQPFITWGGNINVGGGLRLQKHISLLAEYQFIDDKLPGSLISDAGAQGGHAHIWSLTLDPVIDFFPARKNDVYVTGGGGFYRKVTSFTDPELVEECYYFCTVGYEDVVVSHFSSNQGGANFGVGFTHKIGGDEHLKAYAEVRYLWIDTPPIGELNGLGRTELIPVTFGVRW
jgi:Outer membrane protein beta-barrel domain